MHSHFLHSKGKEFFTVSEKNFLPHYGGFIPKIFSLFQKMMSNFEPMNLNHRKFNYVFLKVFHVSK